MSPVVIDREFRREPAVAHRRRHRRSPHSGSTSFGQNDEYVFVAKVERRRRRHTVAG